MNWHVIDQLTLPVGYSRSATFMLEVWPLGLRDPTGAFPLTDEHTQTYTSIPTDVSSTTETRLQLDLPPLASGSQYRVLLKAIYDSTWPTEPPSEIVRKVLIFVDCTVPNVGYAIDCSDTPSEWGPEMTGTAPDASVTLILPGQVCTILALPPDVLPSDPRGNVTIRELLEMTVPHLPPEAPDLGLVEDPGPGVNIFADDEEDPLRAAERDRYEIGKEYWEEAVEEAGFLRHPDDEIEDCNPPNPDSLDECQNLRTGWWDGEPCDPPAPDGNKACKVYLLHGYAGDGPDTAEYSSWDHDPPDIRLYDMLVDEGYEVKRVDYYGGACDSDLGALLDSDYYHDHWFSGGAGTWGSDAVSHREPGDLEGCEADSDAIHTRNTNIQHLAFHVAWAIYSDSDNGREWVDVVAHSMGGLIMRYIMMKVKEEAACKAYGYTSDECVIEDSDEWGMWPARLKVEDIVTLATPHHGAKDACATWGSGSGFQQTRQMCSRHSFMTILKRDGTDPRRPCGPSGSGPICPYFSCVGSQFDAVVTWKSSQGMTCDSYIYGMGWVGSGEEDSCWDELSADDEDDIEPYGHTALYQDGSLVENQCFSYSTDEYSRPSEILDTAPHAGLLTVWAIENPDW